MKPRRRVAVNTAIFAVATALSRIAGLGREVVQASFFGTTAAASAFTIASQVPNLFSNLFAQAALSAAFVPVFTELMQRGQKREALRLASSLFWMLLIGLGVLTLIWFGVAGFVMPLFTGTLSSSATTLTVGLSRVLFPVVLLLSLTGLLVGILQSYDEFTIPALAPAVWNLVIVAGLVILHAQFQGHQDAVYAYAIAWLIATMVQLLMIAWAVKRIDFRFSFVMDWKDPRVREVLILFIPVTLSIGIYSLDVFLNAGFGALVSSAAPAAINDAYRIYMLPQGIFSVAVATVLFPTLSRLAVARNVSGTAPDRRQRDPPDQPAADPVGGDPGRIRDADHTAGVPARRIHDPFHPPDLDGPVLVCLQPPVRRGQPPAGTDVLRSQAAMDPDQARGDEHGR